MRYDFLEAHFRVLNIWPNTHIFGTNDMCLGTSKHNKFLFWKWFYRVAPNSVPSVTELRSPIKAKRWIPECQSIFFPWDIIRSPKKAIYLSAENFFTCKKFKKPNVPSVTQCPLRNTFSKYWVLSFFEHQILLFSHCLFKWNWLVMVFVNFDTNFSQIPTFI